MSNSYKHIPYCGDDKGKNKKRQANKKVRSFLKNLEHDASNNKYRYIYESYDICDFYWIESWENYWHNKQLEYKEHPNWFKYPPNKKEEYRKWYKMYKMK